MYGQLLQVQFFYRVEAEVLESITVSPFIKCAVAGLARSHVDEGSRHRVHLPVTWTMLLNENKLFPAWVLQYSVVFEPQLFHLPDQMTWLPALQVWHILYISFQKRTPYVIFLTYSVGVRWLVIYSRHTVKIRLRRHKGDQDRIGEARTRTQGEVIICSRAIKHPAGQLLWRWSRCAMRRYRTTHPTFLVVHFIVEYG